MANPGASDVKKQGQGAFDQAKDVAGKAVDQAKDVAGKTVDKAKEYASDLADAGRSAMSSAGKAAEHATSPVGEGMKSLGETVRERGPSGGMLGSATSAVADTLDRGGEYLQREGLSGMAGDLTDLIKRNPIPALLVGIGLGFVLARLTRS